VASRTAALFERLAERYDAWYEDPAGRELFAMELACLGPLLQGTTRPRLEVGLGSGRFAAALAVEVGLDPAREPLGLARLRGVQVVQGVGERLPFRDGVFGGVLVVVTLCFADDPQMLLAEARRVLRPGGALVLGGSWSPTAPGASGTANVGRPGTPSTRRRGSSPSPTRADAQGGGVRGDGGPLHPRPAADRPAAPRASRRRGR
jgi:SAM-dependent methyltransferase